jgi:hypothetical protein
MSDTTKSVLILCSVALLAVLAVVIDIYSQSDEGLGNLLKGVKPILTVLKIFR